MSFLDLLRALWADLRIMKAEHHLRQARRWAPAGMRESELLVEATDGYFEQAKQHARWEKFPA